MVWFEHETTRTPEVQSQLVRTCTSKQVEAPRGATDIFQRRRCLQHSESAANDLPLLGTETASSRSVAFAVPGEFAVCPRNLDRDRPLDFITPEVMIDP